MLTAVKPKGLLMSTLEERVRRIEVLLELVIDHVDMYLVPEEIALLNELHAEVNEAAFKESKDK